MYSMPMYLFKFLKEVSILNNKAVNLVYDTGSSLEILYEGSKNCPRKVKKKLRKLIKNKKK